MSVVPEGSWFATPNPEPVDGEALDPRDPVTGDAERVRFLTRRVAVLETGNREKADLIADAVFCLHEAGDHENADRIERLASPF